MAKLDTLGLQLADLNTKMADSLALAICDRRENGLSVGPPAFDGPCQCTAATSIFFEGVEGECCTPLAQPGADQQISPPTCVYVTDGTPVDPDDRVGLPEGLTLEYRPVTECPPSTGEVCVVGTPAEGTGSPKGVVYRFIIHLVNCFGEVTLECSLTVKRDPVACEPPLAP